MWQTLSCTSAGPATLADQKRPPRPYAVKFTNNVSDIDGARSTVPYSDRYSNKPTFNNADVAGSVSRPLTHSRNVRDLSLYIDDIDGTRHSIKYRMMRTKRHVNPLVPEYDLPSFVPARVPEVPFMRDSMNSDDVEGSRPKPLQKFQLRDNISTDDIVGAQACWRPMHMRVRLENEPHDIMSIGEITLKKKRFQDRGQRSTDLMNPIYEVNGMVIEDEARWTKPKPLKKFVPGNHLLQTRDIEGAFSGWGRVDRREYRNIMNTMDVEGAQADTVKHTIASNRITNPLTPVYPSLDGEPLPPLLVPLLPHSIVSVPTLRPSQSKTSVGSRAAETQSFMMASSQALDFPPASSESYASHFVDTSSFLAVAATGKCVHFPAFSLFASLSPLLSPISCQLQTNLRCSLRRQSPLLRGFNCRCNQQVLQRETVVDATVVASYLPQCRRVPELPPCLPARGSLRSSFSAKSRRSGVCNACCCFGADVYGADKQEGKRREREQKMFN